MRLYESVFIARQDVSAQHVEALTKDFSAIIENGGAKSINMNIGVCGRLLTALKRTAKAIMSCLIWKQITIP